MRPNTAEMNQEFAVAEIAEDAPLWPQVWSVVELLNQERYVQVQAEHFRSSHLLVALLDERPIGFLRFVVQRLGEDEERPPIVFRGRTLYEAKIIAFGIQPSLENDSVYFVKSLPAADAPISTNNRTLAELTFSTDCAILASDGDERFRRGIVRPETASRRASTTLKRRKHYKCQKHRHGFQLWSAHDRFRGVGCLSKPPTL